MKLAMTQAARLLAKTLLRYENENCPECYARAEMLADVTPLSPGSLSSIVIPTGWKMTHAERCEVGRVMKMAAQLCGQEQEKER